MVSTYKTKIRHTLENEMLRCALDGDKRAASEALQYLSSANQYLCRIIQEAIHDLDDARIWPELLGCLALHRWNEDLDCDRRSDPTASKRIDQSIIEIFLEDENEGEGPMKEETLRSALKNAEPCLRYVAAYLLGLRGDQRAIPVLAETIESGIKEWQLHAVKALSVLRDERCAPPLLKLLITDRSELHREAGRALRSLGELAKSTWQEALNHPDSHIRWHAARGLGETGDASHVGILAEGLRDENSAVRWATADVLAHLGEDGVLATLAMLTRYKLNEQYRQAADHALHGITSRRVQKRLKPLLDALRGPAASVEAPLLAQRLFAE